MLLLFYDTETTGIIRRNVSSSDPKQPKIVQLGAILYDTDAKIERFVFEKIIRPEGWRSEPKALEAHGITHERAMDEGEDQRVVIPEFLALWREAVASGGHRVGFNEGFDRKMVRIHLETFFGGGEQSDDWLFGNASCMKIASTPICRIPPTEKQAKFHPEKPFKEPKLTEAHEIMLGEPHIKAHGAVDDARATLGLWKCAEAMDMPAAIVALDRNRRFDDEGTAEQRGGDEPDPSVPPPPAPEEEARPSRRRRPASADIGENESF